MKIALVADAFYPQKGGGIAVFLTSMCRAFRDKEHLLYVFNPYFKGKKIFNVFNLKLKNFKPNRLFTYFLIFSCLKIFRDKKMRLNDKLNILFSLFIKPKELCILINNVVRMYPYFEKLNFDLILGGYAGITIPQTFILSRIFGKKVITFTWGNDFIIRPPYSFKPFYFKNLDKIIVVNDRIKYLVKKMYNLDDSKFAIINMGLFLKKYEIKESKEELRRKFRIPFDSFVLISVGRHVPRKRFDLVIKAIVKIKDKRPDINLKYYLIGDGSETPSLKRLKKELKLDDAVIFLGAIGDFEKNRFLKLSDLFLMPSITLKNSIEGFGIVFLEANFYKIPVIGTYSGGMAGAIVDHETGYLIKQGDLNGLVKKIIYLYDNKEEKNQMGLNGYNRVINYFNWEKVYFEYINLFKRILNES